MDRLGAFQLEGLRAWGQRLFQVHVAWATEVHLQRGEIDDGAVLDERVEPKQTWKIRVLNGGNGEVACGLRPVGLPKRDWQTTVVSALARAVANSCDLQWSLARSVCRIHAALVAALRYLLRPAVATQISNRAWINDERRAPICQARVGVVVILIVDLLAWGLGRFHRERRLLGLPCGRLRESIAELIFLCVLAVSLQPWGIRHHSIGRAYLRCLGGAARS